MKSYSIAVVEWAENDGITAPICFALKQMGHDPISFRFNQQIPKNVDIVFSFGPYGTWFHIPEELISWPKNNRPIFVHWDTEGIANPRIPWPLLKLSGSILSRIDRMCEREPSRKDRIERSPLGKEFFTKAFRIRLDGQYHYANNKGRMDIFAETSQIYADINTRRGLETLFVPWATHPTWYADLNLERDIDVLWMGSRRSKRRLNIVEKIRQELGEKGYKMHVIDGVENPAVFDHERNQIINRSKITLNILPAWYFNSFAFRYHVATGNRSLVITETILPHCPMYQPGINYVSAPTEEITDTIIYYLENEAERQEIAESAYNLVTTQMTFTHSLQIFMDKVDQITK